VPEARRVESAGGERVVAVGFKARGDQDEIRAKVARRVRSLGDELGAPVGAVLEGGYDLGALAASVAATLDGLADGGEAPSTAPGPLVAAAAEQVGRYWPGVRGGASPG